MNQIDAGCPVPENAKSRCHAVAPTVDSRLS